MTQDVSSKKSAPLTVFLTLFVTVVTVTIAIFITTKLYQQAHYIEDKWLDYRYTTIAKQQLTRELSTTFSEKGLLGEVRRYAFAPSNVNESHIKSELAHHRNVISDYRKVLHLSTEETRLLITITKELNKLKNAFYLAANFAQKGQIEKSIAIGDQLSLVEGQDSVGKLNDYSISEYNAETVHIDETIRQLVVQILLTLLLVPLVLFLSVSYWNSRHKVSRDVLAKSNRAELDKLFRHSAVPTVIVNRSGDIVNANNGICELTGFSMNHLMSKHLEQIVVQAPTGFLQNIMSFNSTTSPVNSASQVLTNKGEKIHVEIDITQLEDRGTLLSIVSFRDIESAHQSILAQQTISEMYEFCEKSKNIGSWRWNFSNNLLLWSPSTYALYGFDSIDHEISQEIILSTIPAIEREDISNAINEAVIFGNELNVTHHIELPDNSTIFVNQHARVVNDANGKPSYMLGTIEKIQECDETTIMRDMSDRIFNSSLDAMAVTNQRNTILKVNNAFVTTTGFKESEAIGQQLSSVNRATFFDQCIYNKINEQVQKSQSWAGELWNVRKGGEVYPTAQHICALAHEEGTVSRYLCTFRDVTEQKTLEERIINSRAVDKVTMLPSRSVLQDRLNQSIKRHERDGNQSAVLIISIKPYIKEMAEEVHTQVIKMLAQRLIQITRDHDTIARFGYYEFAVLLEGLALAEDAYVVADKIQMKLNQSLYINELSIEPESAIGISLHPLHATNDESLIQYADAAMQQAKLDKNDNIQTFNKHILGIYNHEQHLNTQLQRAIDLKELAVNYQPVISFGSKQIVRCIAHVRWHHRAYNTQDTQRFITSAKSGSLSKPLHDWLLENAIKYATQWSNCGLNQLTLQVKIVATQLQEIGLAQKIKDILNTYQFSPNQLVLEMTHESLSMCKDSIKEELQSLDDIGIRVLVVNVSNTSETMSELTSSSVHQALIERVALTDPQLDNDINILGEQVVNQLKDSDVYPSNFDWSTHTTINLFKDIKTRKQEQFLVCGSVDSQSLIILGNKLQNTTA